MYVCVHVCMYVCMYAINVMQCNVMVWCGMVCMNVCMFRFIHLLSHFFSLSLSLSLSSLALGPLL